MNFAERDGRNNKASGARGPGGRGSAWGRGEARGGKRPGTGGKTWGKRARGPGVRGGGPLQGPGVGEGCSHHERTGAKKKGSDGGPRHPADWAARYRLDVRTVAECQLIDVSSDGAAIELHGVDDSEPLVGPFDLEIMSVTGSDDGIPVRGLIRHRSRTAMGRVLVGIEFGALTVEQLRLLRLLVSPRAAV